MKCGPGVSPGTPALTSPDGVRGSRLSPYTPLVYFKPGTTIHKHVVIIETMLMEVP